MVVNTTPSREDDVKVAILEFLHGKRHNARSVDKAKVGIMEIRKALKEKGMEQKEVIRNLLYLIEARWVKEVAESRQIPTGKVFFTQTQKKYLIANEGMELFDEKSKFSRPDSLAGINIQNVSGVVNIGNNNIIRNERVELFNDLEELENKIRVTDELSDEQKVDYRAEIKTIESQLSKAHPNRDIIRSSWSVLKGVGIVASLLTIYEKVRPAIEQIIGS